MINSPRLLLLPAMQTFYAETDGWQRTQLWKTQRNFLPTEILPTAKLASNGAAGHNNYKGRDRRKVPHLFCCTESELWIARQDTHRLCDAFPRRHTEFSYLQNSGRLQDPYAVSNSLCVARN